MPRLITLCCFMMMGLLLHYAVAEPIALNRDDVIHDINIGSHINAIALSPDGKQLAVAADNDLQIFETSEYKRQYRLRAHLTAVKAIAFTKDGKHLLSGDQKGRVLVWRLKDMRLVQRFKFKSAVEHFVMREKRPRAFAVICGGTDRIIMSVVHDIDDVLEKDVSKMHEYAVTVQTLYEDEQGQKIVFVNNEIEEYRTQKDIAKLRQKQFIDDFLLLPKSQIALTVSDDNYLRYWDVRSGEQLFQIAPGFRGGKDIAYHEGKGFIAAIGKAGPEAVYHMSSGKALAQIENVVEIAEAVAFNHDATQLYLADDTHLNVVSLKTIKFSPKATELTEKKIASHWLDLSSEDKQVEWQAKWALSQGGEEVVEYLAKQIQPGTSAAGKIAKLIGELDHEDFDAREEAAKQLAAMGKLAKPALEKAAESDSPEVRWRANELLEKMADGEVVRDTRGLQFKHGVSILAYIRTPEAIAIIEKLAGGDEKLKLTQRAKEVLQTLQPAKPVQPGPAKANPED